MTLAILLAVVFATTAAAQRTSLSATDRRAELEAGLNKAFGKAQREDCKASDKGRCEFEGLILESQGSKRCSEKIIPIDRFRVGETTRHGVLMTASVSIGWPVPTSLDMPILFLTQDDQPQEICAPDRQIIADIAVGIYFTGWERLRAAEMSRLPGAEADIRWVDPDYWGAHLIAPEPPIRAPGIVDWIFNSGRQEPVKLRISSDPAGGTVFVGKRMIGTTAQEFGLTPTHIRNVSVLLNGKRIPISDCTQVGSRTWVKIFCELPAKAP